MAQIRVTPEELRNGASFLQQRLDALNNEVQQLKGKIDDVAAQWEGAAQSSFIETFTNNLYPVLNQTMPEVVTGIITQLNGAADAIEQTDQELSNAFRA